MRSYDSLRAFVQLARELNFGRAARALHQSPSALSRSIRRLEAELGQQLFERDHHHVALTPAGEEFRGYAVGVLEDWEEFDHRRGAESGPLSGTLHMYCTVTAAQSFVPEVLERFRQLYPEVRLELETGYAIDALDHLRGGAVDATFAALPARLPSGILSREVATTPVVFVAPGSAGPVRTLVGRSRVDWSAVPLVLPAHGLARDHVDAWFRRRSVAPTVYAEILGHEAILSLVALGYGVGVVPRLVLEKSALQDRVVELDVRPRLPDFHIGVCVRERSLTSPLVSALWEATADVGAVMDAQPEGR